MSLISLNPKKGWGVGWTLHLPLPTEHLLFNLFTPTNRDCVAIVVVDTILLARKRSESDIHTLPSWARADS